MIENKGLNTLILWAIIESLKADGYEVTEIKERRGGAKHGNDKERRV
jgi:hypothetical protein